MSSPRSELARLASYVFATLGRATITEADWVRVVSLERQWAPPSKARRLAQIATSLALLRDAGNGALELGLEAEGIQLPLGYRPHLDGIEGAGTGPAAPAALPLFRRIVRRAADHLGASEPDVVGRVNAVQHSFGGLLTAEAAALHYAALQGLDVAPFLEELERGLRPARPSN